MPPVPRAERLQLARALVEGRFATIVQLTPPKGHVGDTLIERARPLKAHSVDVVHIPDGLRGARMSALSLAVLIQQNACIETVLQYSCRDRNLLGMQSDLLGAHAMGVHNVMIVTGDARRSAIIPTRRRCSTSTRSGSTNVVSTFEPRPRHRRAGDRESHGFPHRRPGEPGAEDIDAEIRRFEYKVEAGAEFAVTKPVFDAATFERFFGRIAAAKLPIILGLWPFESVLNAEFMANEVPGVHVPEAVLDRMRRVDSPEAAIAEGVAIARDVGCALKSMVQGVHVGAPSGRIESALEVLAGFK